MKKKTIKLKPTPPLKPPNLGFSSTASALAWLDYCIGCFDKQLKLWRKAARTNKDAATLGSVRYHAEGVKALRWARGHCRQVMLSKDWARHARHDVASVEKAVALVREADWRV